MVGDHTCVRTHRSSSLQGIRFILDSLGTDETCRVSLDLRLVSCFLESQRRSRQWHGTRSTFAQVLVGQFQIASERPVWLYTLAFEDIMVGSNRLLGQDLAVDDPTEKFNKCDRVL